MKSITRLPSPSIVTPLLMVLLLAAPAVPLADEVPSGEPEEGAEAPAPVVPPQIVLKSQIAPEYPPAALAGRFTGAVTVELTVQEDGTVGLAKAIECDHPNLGFEQASIDAVKKWLFEPARDAEGQAVEYTTTFRLHFRRSVGGMGGPRVPYYVTANEVNNATERRNREEPPRALNSVPVGRPSGGGAGRR